MTAQEHALIAKARAFAIKCHRNVNQLYDGLPYHTHLAEVAEYAVKFGYLLPEKDRVLVICVAWCHDLLEDGNITYNDLKKATDEEIADFEESTGKTINEAITEKILAFTPGGPGYLSTKEMLFGDYGSYMQLYNSRTYNKMYEFLDNKYYEKFVYKEDKESDNSDSLMKVVE